MDGMKISTEKQMIYLDNAAAVPVTAESLAFMAENAASVAANQEGIHCAAYKTRDLLSQAATELTTAITGAPDGASLLWDDSGTTMLNIALRLPYFSGGNIITTALEHPALTTAIQRSGAEIRIVKTSGGKIDTAHLVSLLNDETRLVAIHHVQSETGIIQNLPVIKEVIKQKTPNALFLVDTVQSAGKIPIPWQEAEIDFCFISGHKFGNPGGAAMLYRDKTLPDGIKLSAFFKELRDRHYLLGRPEPLTELAMVDSFKSCYVQMAERLARISKLNGLLRNELKSINLNNGKKIILTIAPENASPYIVHLIVPGFQSAVLVRMLSTHNIAVSAGTACAAETKDPGKTLPAMGYHKNDGYSTLRISLWHNTTETMIKESTATLQQLITDY
jgi:cysteine desulfurase